MGGDDVAKQEELKTERTRRVLKWAILVSVLALLVIVAVAIPMALKTVPRSSTSSAAADFNPNRPNNEDDLAPLLPSTSPSSTPTGTASPTSPPSYSPAPTNDRPSLRPSSTPTAPPPTPNPTNVPSVEPSTEAPTAEPIDPNYRFKLRLFWQSGYYWQESWDEVWHCVECTGCEEYGTGDGWEHGCENRGDGNSANCREGDMFWVHDCVDRGSEFNLLTNSKGMQVRVAGTNLCIGRGGIDGETGIFRNRILTAVKCDRSDDSQLWATVTSLSKFELRPLDDANKSEDNAECISQLHHPKNEEVISLHGCKLSRIYETRYWEEYQD